MGSFPIGINFCKAARLEGPPLFASSTPIMKLSSVVYQTRNDSKWDSWQSDHQFVPSFGCPILRKLLVSGGFWPPDEGLCLWTLLRAMPPDTHYKLALRVCHGQGPSTFFIQVYAYDIFPGQKLAGCFTRNEIAIGSRENAFPGPAVALDGPGAQPGYTNGIYVQCAENTWDGTHKVLPEKKCMG